MIPPEDGHKVLCHSGKSRRNTNGVGGPVQPNFIICWDCTWLSERCLRYLMVEMHLRLTETNININPSRKHAAYIQEFLLLSSEAGESDNRRIALWPWVRCRWFLTLKMNTCIHQIKKIIITYILYTLRYTRELLNCLATAEVIHVSTNEAGSLVYHIEEDEKPAFKTPLMPFVSFLTAFTSVYGKVQSFLPKAGPYGNCFRISKSAPQSLLSLNECVWFTRQ